VRPAAKPTELRRLTGEGRYAANCQHCSWTSHAKNALAGAAGHARTYRHKTVVRVERVTLFDGRAT
jgi:hypothetical protein